jgi:hypothetical protein
VRHSLLEPLTALAAIRGYPNRLFYGILQDKMLSA